MAHRDPRKSQRRAIAALQDCIEAMSSAELRAAVDTMSLPTAPVLWTKLSLALRAQIATNSENDRIGRTVEENPEEPDDDPDDVD